MVQQTLANRMEHVVRTYIQACNDADAEAITACFCADAVHYMPVNDRGLESWRGAVTIGTRSKTLVKASGRNWTVDQQLTDAGRHATILEWTAFNGARDRLVRGVDWFDFDPQTLLIKTVRSFVATMSNPEDVRVEQQNFDYAGRGYPTL
ncbi:MAG TPA: nuclear transport factor 2 family protein [Caulobacteraceae bacterium]